ncbi:MAG: MurR/RpiR family transcriptional regulator [Spirochaetales bacterium]
MEGRSDGEGVLEGIQARLSLFPEAERKVARCVLLEPKKALHSNVRELAARSGVSQAAVIRFCKRIGLESYGDFKLKLAQDVFSDLDQKFMLDLDLESMTSPEKVIQSVIRLSQRGLSSLGALLDPKILEAASEAIPGASMTVLFGVGASSIVANDFLHKLLRIGLPTSFAHDTDLQVTAAASIKPTDVAFIVSYSGETAIMIEAAKQAKGRGAKLISLTMDSANTIRSMASINLLVPSSERIYRQAAVTSRINQLTVIDILYSIIVSKNLDTSIEAIERTMRATHRRKGL